ncbi:phosphotransferase [Alkalihalobacillus sp. AL-G]|uniref:phosphotransferase n=1 Tax=Alkalihalobacillus sp. AL-G TaxID=2926399 RepID=UPI00272AD0EF|nr:phosphotransferase [Alkalihalobacillus sp. AL-G]WLD92596.1 phosphotransferase [Alkalihalobacillus sp. AL-G]
MNSVNKSDIREGIFKTLNNKFGLKILNFSQIDLGYLNLKWKVKTDVGDLFVKQYNKIRYPDHRINELEISLHHQAKLLQEGIPCPQLYAHNGKYVNRTSDGTNFVLMGLCEGTNIKPGAANEEQVYSLGKIIARIHQILNSDNAGKPPLHWNLRSKDSMLKDLQNRRCEAISMDCDKTISILDTQKKIIETTNLNIFSDCEQGWCHWDLFSDNILFKPDGVSAILDFDRMHYVYPEFDISRPILSCCMKDGRIDVNKVSAFVKGYREYQTLTKQQLVRSIKLTWWKEAEWVRVEEKQNSSLKRFTEENIWVGENWDHLESLFAKV